MAAKPPDGNDFMEAYRVLEKRVRNLERVSRNRTEFYDPEEDTYKPGRVQIDKDGNYIWASSTGNNGTLYPHQYTNFVDPSTILSISSSTWTTVGESELQVLDSDVMQWSAALTVPSGTTVGVRIYDPVNAVAFATQTQAGVVNNIICEWLHPFTVGWGDNGYNSGKSATAFFQYQVRRESGAGTIFAFFPRSLMLRSSHFTTNHSATTPFTFF